MSTVIRVAEWLGWAFCTLVASLWAWSGQPGFTALWLALAFVYLWLIADRPSPRTMAIMSLYMVTGRQKPDRQKIARLDRDLGYKETWTA